MSAAHAEPGLGCREGRLAALPGSFGGAATFGACAAAVGLLGIERGGYYATAWSLGTIAALAIGAVSALRAGALRLDSAFVVPFAAFVGWMAIEAARPGAATRAMPEVQRAILYVTVVWAAGQLIGRHTVRAALAGVLASIGALLLDGLVHVLLPVHITADAVEGRLLFLPLGYANACGVLAAIAIVLTLGRDPVRSPVAAALVPLAVALELTQSKGALLALAAGLVATTLLHPQPRALVGRALVLLPLPVLAAGLAAHSHVADQTVSASVVARDCVVVAVATCVAAVLQLAIARWTLVPPAGVVVAAVVVVIAGTCAAALKGFGDRLAYWHVAWHSARAHPLLGSGPGTFAREWLAHRPTPVGALNAHNLYLETLAELGPVGLTLLLLALAAPLVAARRHRSPVAAVAAGGYATFLAHAAVDWDWQMPAVTVAGLLCGVCAMRAASAARPSRRGLQPALALASLLALAVATAGVGDAALAAANRGASPAALRAGRLAELLQPWSAVPLRRRAELALSGGDRPRAQQLLEQAVRLDRDDATSWYDLIVVGTRSERTRAVQMLERLDPFAVRASRP